MVLVTRTLQGLVPFWMLLCPALAQHDKTQNYSAAATTHDAFMAMTVSVCEARTINHITDTLPPLCFTNSWTSHTLTHNDTYVSGVQTTSTTSSTTSPTTSPTIELTVSETPSATGEGNDEQLDGEPTPTQFMSFEDWKEMMLRRTGQDPQELDSRKPSPKRGDDRVPPDLGDFGLGEDEEISLDFDNFLDKTHHDKPTASAQDNGHVAENQAVERGKDAGKTCKERFSYSSFDAGATVLKTGPSTKNAKAILVENKDSYMLLECSKQSKYVIVELSDDILIDTVVLANFEFFSSMIRHFKVSVSDRYPVKSERWRDIGTFEARNSRDIQPFLVDNPQIWAKYVRIDFLTHYGKEYYCPVSLLRIHGNRMLDSWKDSETVGEEELAEEEAMLSQNEAEKPKKTTEAADVTPEGRSKGTPSSAPESPIPNSKGGEKHTSEMAETTPSTFCASNPFYAFIATCDPNLTPFTEALPNLSFCNQSNGQTMAYVAAEGRNENQTLQDSNTKSQLPNQEKLPNASTQTHERSNPTQYTRSSTQNNSASTTITGEATASPSASVIKASNTASSSHKHRSGGIPNASSGTPPAQEGFFNAITKRLHNVETNLTLSLQYLEDQSRYVQEALRKAEQKQLSKVANFLENLNQTVFTELRGMRDQYDQIWQSTVIALESQRDQSERDIVALSSRLNLLADEVVFQKRMAIVQAVLLLCCLFLVIFSRGVPIPYLAPLLEQNSSAGLYAGPSQMQSQELYTPIRDGSETGDLHASQMDSSPPNLGDSMNRETLQHELANAARGDAQTELPQYPRLSPPLTPTLDAVEENGLKADITGPDFQTPVPRRASSYQQIHCRKPLPALPEHPPSPTLEHLSLP